MQLDSGLLDLPFDVINQILLYKSHETRLLLLSTCKQLMKLLLNRTHWNQLANEIWKKNKQKFCYRMILMESSLLAIELTDLKMLGFIQNYWGDIVNIEDFRKKYKQHNLIESNQSKYPKIIVRYLKSKGREANKNGFLNWNIALAISYVANILDAVIINRRSMNNIPLSDAVNEILKSIKNKHSIRPPTIDDYNLWLEYNHNTYTSQTVENSNQCVHAVHGFLNLGYWKNMSKIDLDYTIQLIMNRIQETQAAAIKVLTAYNKDVLLINNNKADTPDILSYNKQELPPKSRKRKRDDNLGVEHHIQCSVCKGIFTSDSGDRESAFNSININTYVDETTKRISLDLHHSPINCNSSWTNTLWKSHTNNKYIPTIVPTILKWPALLIRSCGCNCLKQNDTYSSNSSGLYECCSSSCLEQYITYMLKSLPNNLDGNSMRLIIDFERKKSVHLDPVSKASYIIPINKITFYCSKICWFKHIIKKVAK